MPKSKMILPRNYKGIVVFLIHLAFWILYAGLLLIVLDKIIPNRSVVYAIGVTNLSGLILATYIYLLVLIPRYWETKKYVRFFLWIFILLLVSAGIRFLLVSWVVDYFGQGSGGTIDGDLFVQFFIGGFVILMMASPLHIVNVYFKKKNLETQLSEYKLEAELKFLKAQVNPHFLFNALNNIYSLSFVNSKQAPAMILKLSEMMSFMLYDCKEEYVPLSNEIVYLHNYISLQQLKKEGEQDITLEVNGNLNGINIPPMLFIPFFENAFKHGNIQDTRKGYIRSHFQVFENQILFTIKNSIAPFKTHYEKGGIGLENVRKRLELLYPNRHTFEILEKDDYFEIRLELMQSKPQINV